MATIKVAFLLLALVGTVSAQVRAAGSRKVNICVSIGNNVHSTLTVPSTELSNYPGYVKGACRRVCSTVCKDVLREVNTASGQCICKGTAIKCGANAKPTNDKKRCKCLAGFKGDPLKGCVDVNECAKSPCPENNKCTNTVGSFECKAVACPEDQYFYPFTNRCHCHSGYEYTDQESSALVCLPQCGANAHRWPPATTPSSECQCDDNTWTGDPNIACCPINAFYIHGQSRCACEQDFYESWDNNGLVCLPFCGLNAFRDMKSETAYSDCQCYYEGYIGDPTIACCPANAHANDGDTDCTCNEGYTKMWNKSNDGGYLCVKTID